jgi:hypothetical protein
MYSITTFQELLKGLPHGTVSKFIATKKADKYAKRFGHWDHLIAMLYAQLIGSPSLRAIEAGFNSHRSHHYHLHTSPIKRSTLADANEKRTGVVFSEIAGWLMGQVSRQLRRDGAELMYLLDSTSLTLKGREFDRWTSENQTRNTQGIKLHVLIDANDAVPVWHSMTAPNVNDITEALNAPLLPGALYVFDKGYNDYNWWFSIDQAGARFVSRFKRNAGLRITEQLPIPADDAHIVLADELVTFNHRQLGARRINRYHGKQLRRVTVARPDKDTPIVLVTNDMNATAVQIAQNYKDRWGIELFFKWVKQHLQIKQFLGRSENAVRNQVMIALIGYLLIALYKATHHATKTMWECLCIIRPTLFQRRETERIVCIRRGRQTLVASHQTCLF